MREPVNDGFDPISDSIYFGECTRGKMAGWGVCVSPVHAYSPWWRRLGKKPCPPIGWVLIFTGPPELDTYLHESFVPQSDIPAEIDNLGVSLVVDDDGQKMRSWIARQPWDLR